MSVDVVGLASQSRRPRDVVLARLLRQRGAVIGGAVVLIVAGVALFAPLIAPLPYDATDLLNVFAPPDAINLLGTDKLGRDILSRLIFGARTSLVVGISVMLVTIAFGTALGMVAGYFGGRTDTLIMRGVDIMLAFPEVVFAILVAAVLGPGIATVIVALSLVWWPGIARLARSLVLVHKQELYVDAAIVAGASPFEILRRHLLPNIIPPLLVRASVGIGLIIMAEATLSFLGLGVQEPTPSWGGMIRDGLPALRSDPYLAISSSIVLGITIIGFNLFGDGLRDALDPKLHGR
jgi:ABC-type dipeptide/oligopeptide/nickel transport system permease subunit